MYLALKKLLIKTTNSRRFSWNAIVNHKNLQAPRVNDISPALANIANDAVLKQKSNGVTVYFDQHGKYPSMCKSIGALYILNRRHSHQHNSDLDSPSNSLDLF